MVALRNLVAGVVHEVNNPIGVVNSAADILDRGFDKVVSELQMAEFPDTQFEKGDVVWITNVTEDCVYVEDDFTGKERFCQLTGDSGAVYGDKWTLFPATLKMNCAGNQFFAGSTFAGNQN